VSTTAEVEVLDGRGSYTKHPLASLILPMSDDEFDALRKDVAASGLHEPIVLYDEQILDGWHRFRACAETGTEPKFEHYEGSDPVGYVVSLNFHRRHLNASQRAVIALEVEAEYAKGAKERQGARTDLILARDLPPRLGGCSARGGESARKAAQVVGVSHGYVSDAKAVRDQAPDLLGQVSKGLMTLPQAKKEILRRAKAERVAKIAEQTPAPIVSLGPFPVLCADPPWRYQDAEPSLPRRRALAGDREPLPDDVARRHQGARGPGL
jgi:hypothetical protein